MKPTTQFWRLLRVVDGNYPFYDPEQYYRAGAIVRYNSNFYTNIMDIWGWNPTSAFWRKVSSEEYILSITPFNGILQVVNAPDEYRVDFPDCVDGQDQINLAYLGPTEILLRVFPERGYTFKHWVVAYSDDLGNEYIYDQNPVTIDLDDNLTVHPEFEQSYLSREDAMQKALEWVEFRAGSSEDDLWTSSSIIEDAFPAYIDGIDDISYYECKVTTDGQDAGYVLVNANQADIVIPEYTTEGKTQTERFTEACQLPRQDLRLYRYGWFKTAAKALNRDNDTYVLTATQGFDMSGDIHLLGHGQGPAQSFIDSIRTIYRNKAETEGCAAYRTKEENFFHYNGDAWRLAEVADSLGMNEIEDDLVRGVHKEYRWTEDHLNHTFETGWHLPKWTQIIIPDG